MNKHLGLLGFKVRDKVTGLEGVCHHIGFDLYGCIQAIVHPGLDEKGALRDTLWFDVNRLKVISDEPVMAVPDFSDKNRHKDGNSGCAEKPA